MLFCACFERVLAGAREFAGLHVGLEAKNSWFRPFLLEQVRARFGGDAAAEEDAAYSFGTPCSFGTKQKRCVGLSLVTAVSSGQTRVSH